MYDTIKIRPETWYALKSVLLVGISYVLIQFFLAFIVYMVIKILKKAYKILSGRACKMLFSKAHKILSGILSALKVIFSHDVSRNGNEPDYELLEKAIEAAGYKYDKKQDIFYSHLNPWQRNFGYCRLYDEALAPFGMIIDCEPIYFEYDGKRWMIEFWKGQYDLATGCEVGIYTTEGSDLNIPGIFKGTFYNCASDDDNLSMSYSLKKNGKRLFTRRGRHWWLTGFILGEFSEPSELVMYVNIKLKNRAMRDEFVKGLEAAGYSDKEITRRRNSINLKFDKPHAPQPFSRTYATDWIIQRKNKLLCDKFQFIVKGLSNLPDKVKAIKEKDTVLFEQVINIGKTKQVFEIYNTIRKYQDKNIT